MTDQERAELIANTYHTPRCDCSVLFNKPLGVRCQKLADSVMAALTLARSEGREEGMKEHDDLSRRETEGLLGRQPAASENGR